MHETTNEPCSTRSSWTDSNRSRGVAKYCLADEGERLSKAQRAVRRVRRLQEITSSATTCASRLNLYAAAASSHPPVPTKKETFTSTSCRHSLRWTSVARSCGYAAVRGRPGFGGRSTTTACRRGVQRATDSIQPGEEWRGASGAHRLPQQLSSGGPSNPPSRCGVRMKASGSGSVASSSATSWTGRLREALRLLIASQHGRYVVQVCRRRDR